MNRNLASMMVLALACCVAAPAHAQDPTEVSGSLLMDKRFLASDWFASDPSAATPQIGFYSKAEVKLQRWLGENLQVVASAQFRYFDMTEVASPDDLSSPEKQMPFQFFPWEVFIRAHGVLLEGLDLSVGKQRIAWGKADKLNPTDTLNPDDFTDIFDFGAKVPSTSAVITYTFPEDISLTAAWLPAVRPVLTSEAYPQVKDLATAQQQAVLMKGMAIPGITVVPGDNQIRAPLFDLEHSMQAVRLEGSLFGVDLSVSYFHGFEDIPVLKKADAVVAAGESGMTATVNTESGFMPFQQVGLDLAYDLFGVGLWAEAAFVMPEGVETTVTAGALLPEKRLQTLSDDPYVRFTVGGDYTFEGGYYVNLQYAHGLSHEIDKEMVSEYLVGRFQKKLLGETLMLALNGGFATPAWGDAGDQYGFLVNPEVSYKPFDNLELLIGAYVVEGQGEESLFSTLDGADQVYLKAKASF